MRRFGCIALLASLLALVAAPALAENEWGEYRDEFKNVAYNGSVGSLDWKPSPWSELNDGGSGPGSGVVQVAQGDCVGSKCLHIYADGGAVDGIGVKRSADTSVFTWFELCYEVRFDPSEGESDAWLSIEKQVNGGGPWYQLAEFQLGEEGFQAHPIHEIGGPYASTTIRFVVDGYLDGELFIDDVELKGSLGSGSTTTTTSTSTTTTTSTTTSTPNTTTTTLATTTTTRRAAEPTTTTTEPAATTTTVDESDGDENVGGVLPPGGNRTPPPGSGLRETERGLQVVFDDDLFGNVRRVSGEFASVDHDVNFIIAAEVIGASWVWMVLLGCVIGWAGVSGLERSGSFLRFDRS